jgi:hypothetical protein
MNGSCRRFGVTLSVCKAGVAYGIHGNLEAVLIVIDRYPQVAESFDQYNLTVMTAVASSEEPIDELFVRLNRSKPLTGAEIRNAMRGPAPGIIRRISRHNFFQVCARFQMKRAQDQNAAALTDTGHRYGRRVKRNWMFAVFVEELDYQV